MFYYVSTIFYKFILVSVLIIVQINFNHNCAQLQNLNLEICARVVN